MRRKRPQRKPQKPKHRVNDYIRVPEVRVVGDGIEATVMTTEKALKLAYEKEMDLVEISPNARPPVCKIVDYKKFLFEQRKREKEIKNKAAKTVIKEIRFGPNTDDHDFEFKLRHAEKFLKEGAKVKAYVHFRGRSILFKDRGEILLLKFADRLSELGSLEGMPRLEGKRMSMMIASKTKAPKKSDKKKERSKDSKKDAPAAEAKDAKLADAADAKPATDAVDDKPAADAKDVKPAAETKDAKEVVASPTAEMPAVTAETTEKSTAEDSKE